MTRVNKKNISQELREKAWKRFDPEKFLTSSEKVAVEKRMLIVLLLEQGFSYTKIGETLDVTRTTISFVKHGLKRTPRAHFDRGSIKSHKGKMGGESPLMSPAEHMRRMRRKGLL